MRHLFISLFLLATLSLSIASSKKSCIPTFSLEEPWLGGDSAYSISLEDGRVLWIFGDTLYGKQRKVVKNIPIMTHNSFGISTCGEKGWNLTYYIKDIDTKTPQAFFEPPKNSTYFYWAFDGVLVDEDLWITLLRVEYEDGSPFGFRTAGADLAKVSNIDAKDPSDWKVEIQDLVPDGVKAYPGATVLVIDDFMYMFADYETTQDMVLTRINTTLLNKAKENMEFLHKNGSWVKSEFDPKEAKVVMNLGSSEMSIRYHSSQDLWVLFQPDSADKIMMRTAKDIEGPWSDQQEIYKYPEMTKGNKKYDNDTFCYAVKEHVEFENKTDEILMTYVCNTMNIDKIVDHLEIYYPQVLHFDLEDLLEKGKDSDDKSIFKSSVFWIVIVGVLLIVGVGVNFITKSRKQKQTQQESLMQIN